MAQTFELACHDCRVILWIGQRDTGASTFHLYTAPEALQRVGAFLYGHRGHRLECCDSEHAAALEYLSLDAED